MIFSLTQRVEKVKEADQIRNQADILADWLYCPEDKLRKGHWLPLTLCVKHPPCWSVLEWRLSVWAGSTDFKGNKVWGFHFSSSILRWKVSAAGFQHRGQRPCFGFCFFVFLFAGFESGNQMLPESIHLKLNTIKLETQSDSVAMNHKPSKSYHVKKRGEE